MRFAVLPMRNTAIVEAYLAGVGRADLMRLNRCSYGRIDSILRAYDVPLRDRREAILLGHRGEARKARRYYGAG